MNKHLALAAAAVMIGTSGAPAQLIDLGPGEVTGGSTQMVVVAFNPAAGGAAIWSQSEGLVTIAATGSGYTTAGVTVHQGDVIVGGNMGGNAYTWEGAMDGTGAWTMLPLVDGITTWTVRCMASNDTTSVWIAGNSNGTTGTREAIRCLLGGSPGKPTLPSNGNCDAYFYALSDTDRCAGRYQYGAVSPSGSRQAMGGYAQVALWPLVGAPSTANEGVAQAISHNGVRAGGWSTYSGAPAGYRQATIWTIDNPSSPVAVPFLGTGDNYSEIQALDHDGTNAGGYTTVAGSGNKQAIIWDAVNGTRDLATVATAMGVSIPSGWTLTDVKALGYTFSGDFAEFVVAGNARDSGSVVHGWVMTMPPPTPWVVTRLTNDNHEDANPRVSHGNVVWEYNDGNDWEIRFHNGSTTTSLTNNSYYDGDPRISGATVAWCGDSENQAGGEGREIWVYNGGSSSCFTCGRDDIAGYWSARHSPSISGSRLAWIEWRGAGNIEAWYADFGGPLTQLTSTSYDEWGPQVSGTNIAWQGNAGYWAASYEIFYNGIRLTDNDVYDQDFHLDGSTVVWKRLSSPVELWYSSGGATPVQIPIPDYGLGRPWISGSRVVYARGVPGEIYLYDLNTSSETQISDAGGVNSGNNEVPVIDGTLVAWSGQPDPAYPEEGCTSEIYVYDISTGGPPIRITHNTWCDRGPYISGGVVTWRSSPTNNYGGSDWEIFKAVRVDDLDYDGVLNASDNCPTVWNPGQEDDDADGVGDVCDNCADTIPGSPVDSNGCPPLIPGDYDRDGDVDGDDYSAFDACISGPAVPYTGDCASRDFDTDNDVDQEDFNVFQRCFGGEDNPGDPDCAD